MPKLLNIFSKPRKQIKIVEKPKIIADYREKNSLVLSGLNKLNCNVEIKELKVADYLVRDVAIERKTVSDFLSSMTNRRLLKQLEDLQQYKNKLLIIEGMEDQELYNEESNGINSNAIRGFLLSITLRYKVPIIFTKNAEDTSKFLCVLAKKKTNGKLSLNVSKKNLDSKEQMQFILEGFPGIGPSTSKKLLKKYKTLKEIFNTSAEELQKTIGKKAEIFK
ncbi:MAG: hypothetical protein KKB31_05445, partial [Nanoarchaeota archaeon]|nr:hypothetical protein [Nanoarchaeota archaeon]